jgi:hypothetical protein
MAESLKSHYLPGIKKAGGLRCKYCDEEWKSLTLTTMRAHLSTKAYGLKYGITLCKKVPPDVSDANESHFNEVNKIGVRKEKRDASEIENDEYVIDQSAQEIHAQTSNKRTVQPTFLESMGLARRHAADISSSASYG